MQVGIEVIHKSDMEHMDAMKAQLRELDPGDFEYKKILMQMYNLFYFIFVLLYLI